MVKKIRQGGGEPGIADDHLRVYVIIMLVAACLLITILAFELDVDLIAIPIFFLPILYATWFYPKGGIVVAGICAVAFEIIGFMFRYPGITTLAAITIQAVVFIGIAGIFTFLIDRIHAGEVRFRTVFDHSQLGIVCLDRRDCSIVSCNRKFAVMLHFMPEELTGRKFTEFFPDTGERERFLSGVQKGEEINEVETSLLTHDGSVSWVSLSWSRAGDQLISCTAVDINARKQAENTINDNITRYRQLTENSPMSIVVVQDGAIRFANPAFGRFLGYPVAELMGKDLCAFIDEKKRADCTAILQSAEITTPDTREGEFQFRTQGGEVQIAGFFMTVVRHINRPAALITLIDTTAQQHLEEKIRIDNERRRGIIMTVAHELRTPLQPIMGYLNLLVQDPEGFGLNDETKNILEKCIASVDRERQIINQMLDLSVVESGKLKLSVSEFSLPDLIGKIIDASGYAAKAEIKTEIPVNLTVTADKDRMFIVLDSLLSNAITYSKPPRLISVTYTSGPQDSYHHIAVADNGIGIPEYALSSIFEPFQLADAAKLSRQYERIGISLSIAKKVMQLHGGDIRVTSTVGTGSTFTIQLPKET
jgi:PAS domain S-box-containing protein